MPVRVEDELSALARMPPARLREMWHRLCVGPVPRVSPSLLRLALAYRLQEKAHGGLPRRVTQRLDQLAGGRTRTQDVRPGMRLVREWNGRLHVVTIAEDGSVLWNERVWRSLSEVAREITGTRWSGPAFFGLKHKAAAA